MVLQPLPTSPAKLVDPPLFAGVQSQCPSPGIISFLFKKKKKFIWLHWVSVAALGIFFAAACGIWFPDQGSNPGPLN